MNKTGPKTNYKLTDNTVIKLEEAFAMDTTVEEACFYADISRDTYYRWIKEKPELSDKLERLRQNPILKARKTVVEGLDDIRNAQWYLERKKKEEFVSKPEVITATQFNLGDILKKLDK